MTVPIWTYNNVLITDLSDMPDDTIGFVYEITTKTNKKYVGRKLLYTVRKRKFGKKEAALVTDKRLKLYEMAKKESNWKVYTGSNTELNEDIKNGMKYTKKILYFAKTKKQLSYLETKELFLNEVIEPHTNYYNSNINGTYYCPFCHHHKKKLEVHVESQKWQCWVCGAKGLKIYNLLKKLNVEPKTLTTLNKIYGNDYIVAHTTTEPEIELLLPEEFISLAKEDTTFNPLYKRVIYYLNNRNITKCDIIRYNIGYCKTGRYAGRIIIPSYDINGKLNYFVARTVFDDEEYKYKNPLYSKNIIVSNTTDINIMLDADAQSQALYYTNFFRAQGVRVKNIIPNHKDASEMGFAATTKIIRETDHTNYSDIISQKLNNL